MMKTWDDSEQGFLVECRAIEGGASLTEKNDIEEELTVEEFVQVVLKKFENVLM